MTIMFRSGGRNEHLCLVRKSLGKQAMSGGIVQGPRVWFVDCFLAVEAARANKSDGF